MNITALRAPETSPENITPAYYTQNAGWSRLISSGAIVQRHALKETSSYTHTHTTRALHLRPHRGTPKPDVPPWPPESSSIIVHLTPTRSSAVGETPAVPPCTGVGNSERYAALRGAREEEEEEEEEEDEGRGTLG